MDFAYSYVPSVTARQFSEMQTIGVFHCQSDIERHRLTSNPDTVRFGIFYASFGPLLTVESGDTVTVECVSGDIEVMPPPSLGHRVPTQLRAIRPHILTGPIAIAGAEPGDMLEVLAEAVEPAIDCGYCAVRPLAGIWTIRD